MHVARILLCSFFLLAPVPRAIAQGTIIGRVHDGRGAPVRDARISVLTSDRNAGTDSEGRFVIRAVPAGAHRLVVTALGFAPDRRTLAVVAHDTTVVEIGLERSALSLAAVTVTATPTGRDPLAVAQPTSTLGTRDLERVLGATLTATLAREPGVAARYQGPAATLPIIRGLTGDRIVMLQDGQRAGDLASTASDHGVTIDPLAAHQVEIVRGPAALLYGSNALGGVINVIADDIPRVIPERRSASFGASGETASEGAGMLLEVTQPLGSSTALRIKLGGRSHDDLRLSGTSVRPVLENTSMWNRHGVIGLSTVRSRASGGIALRRYGFEYGLPWRDDPGTGVRLRGGRTEVSARGDMALPGAITGVRADATAQWYEHDEVNTNGSVGTALALRTQQAQLLARTAAAGWLRDGAIGASVLLRQNGVAGPQALTPPNASDALGLFAFQEIVVGQKPKGTGRFSVPLGVRVERSAVRSEASAHFGQAQSRVFNALSASAGVAIPVARDASIAFNLARAVRSPTAEELFSRAGHAGTGAYEIGNPDLRAERTTGFDAVLRIERPVVRAQLAAFLTDVDGWIGLYAVGRDTLLDVGSGSAHSLPILMVSQRRARLRGVEGVVETSILGHVVASLTGDLVEARDGGGMPLPFMPPARMGTAIRWDDGRWQVGGAVRHAFAQNRVPNEETRTAAYTLLDAHAGLRVMLAGHVHSFTLRGENLGDVLYRDAASRIKDFAPNPGRNVSLAYRIFF